jgi:hypothetical protein
MMASELDVYRAAKLLIDRHGETAPAYAPGRDQQLLEDGDKDGAAVWYGIKVAMEVLQ